MAFVLGGGAGNRLMPLTKDRAKPALPFGGNYRVIDFVLSNLIHSRIRKIYVLTQYEPRSLEKHILEGWVPIFGSSRYNSIRLLPAKSGSDSGWYAGTADAINQNKRYAWEDRPDIINIFGGDHIYLMDISQMNDFHLSKGSDLTISVIPVRCETAAGKYGVLVVDNNWKLIGFEEKPEKPTSIPGNNDYCLASMGNYSFRPQVLIEELVIDQHKKFSGNKETIILDPDHYSSHDFGYDVIPAMLKRRRNIFCYNFNDNIILGSKKNERAYWRDIGDLDEFYQANMDLIKQNPSINLYNDRWGIFTNPESMQPLKITENSNMEKSLISNGSVINNASIYNSILSYNVCVGEKSEISDSFLMGYNEIGKGVIIKKSIIDRDIYIPDGTQIGLDRKSDLKRNLFISKEGITVVPKKYNF
ncbi:MAG: sugar phosphate nucleotidyltransferase [Actinobacteria bacterium]|nr:sugar phosphate nucleotidyltransferase [Actinomycetota bacterium]